MRALRFLGGSLAAALAALTSKAERDEAVKAIVDGPRKALPGDVIERARVDQVNPHPSFAISWHAPIWFGRPRPRRAVRYDFSGALNPTQPATRRARRNVPRTWAWKGAAALPWAK